MHAEFLSDLLGLSAEVTREYYSSLEYFDLAYQIAKASGRVGAPDCSSTTQSCCEMIMGAAISGENSDSLLACHLKDGSISLTGAKLMTVTIGHALLKKNLLKCSEEEKNKFIYKLQKLEQQKMLGRDGEETTLIEFLRGFPEYDWLST